MDPLEKLDLFTNDVDVILRICNDLLSLGCCGRCTLRFLGEKNPSIYSSASSDEELMTKYFHRYPAVAAAAKESSHKLCPSCLSILPRFACKGFYEKVVQKVREEEYDFSDYQFSLIVPVSTIVRERSLYVYLLQNYMSTYEEKENGIPSIKDVFKWSSGDFSDLLGSRFQTRSAFDILLTVNYEASDQECSFLLDLFPDTFRRRKFKKAKSSEYVKETFTRASVYKVLKELNPSDFSKQFSCPPSSPSVNCTCDIALSHDAVFIAGRYNKYSRQLSQTPWVIDGQLKMESCVEELVCQVVLDRFKPTDSKFSSSGREDVDVQMLGLGRPFVVELINPHRVTFAPEEMAAIQKETNLRTDDIAIRDLQIVTREDVGKLKEGEEDKSKSYVALCWCSQALTQEGLEMIASTKDLVLQQKTPIRVLHRRTLATRERTVYSMHIEPTGGLQFKLHLSTQAGTYVKEFVHGDFGRTVPNLGTLLGADCDILTLDVTAVNVDWPTRIDMSPVAVPTDKAEDGKSSSNGSLDVNINRKVASIEIDQTDTK